jgi:hypothetical protein
VALAWRWRGAGVVLAWRWYGAAVALAWRWRGAGVVLAWRWRGAGMALLWRWRCGGEGSRRVERHFAYWLLIDAPAYGSHCLLQNFSAIICKLHSQRHFKTRVPRKTPETELKAPAQR